MNSWAIVAIPSDHDDVWEVSSEKKPHLTILYLGKPDESWNPKLKEIVEYIEHTVKISSLHHLSLWVDQRGTLGDDEADVLFFDKDDYDLKKLESVRSDLLKNPKISLLYNSVEQFPTWTPHLTLGYPESPAKSTGRGQSEFSTVRFDRLALWVGDFEGPEFPLNKKSAGEVAMSNQIDEFLSHFGIKGMKWGVRRSNPSASIPASEDARRADEAQAKAKIGGTKALSNQELQALVNRMNLEQQYSRMKPPSKKEKALKFVGEVLVNVGKQQATRLATDQAAKLIGSLLTKK